MASTFWPVTWSGRSGGPSAWPGLPRSGRCCPPGCRWKPPRGPGRCPIRRGPPGAHFGQGHAAVPDIHRRRWRPAGPPEPAASSRAGLRHTERGRLGQPPAISATTGAPTRKTIRVTPTIAAARRSEVRRNGLRSGHNPRSHSPRGRCGSATTRLMSPRLPSTVRRGNHAGVETIRPAQRDLRPFPAATRGPFPIDALTGTRPSTWAYPALQAFRPAAAEPEG